jgi:hypothetical protein
MSGTSQSRKRRGRDTEHMVASWFAGHGWPGAHATGAGTPGDDILGVPFSVEVKARRGLDLPALLTQMSKRNPDRYGVGVLRLNGHGLSTLPDWPVVMTLSTFTRLAHAAGLNQDTTNQHAPLHNTTTQGIETR